MEKLTIQIAEFIFEISFEPSEPPFKYDYYYKEKLTNYYKRFIRSEYSGKVHFKIHLSKNLEIESFVRKRKKETFIKLFEYKSKYSIKTYYHLSEDQFYLVLRNGLQILLKERNGVIVHGSASVINNKAIIFLGKSGAGKSTIMTILAEKYLPVADDSFIIRKINDTFMVFSTPLIEKNSWIKKTSKGFPLHAAFFLKKDSSHSIRRLINKDVVFRKFVSQIFSTQNDYENQIKTFFRLVYQENFFYELRFGLADKESLIGLLNKHNE